MTRRINLLEGNIFSSLTRLALPIMATSLIQMAYNMTDMIWIGNLGANAVASVGAAGMFGWLSQSIATLARMGGQVNVGHRLGAGASDEAALYAQNALQLEIVLSILFGLVMMLFTSPLIGFFRLNGAQTIQDAESYLFITGGLIVFSTLNQVFTGLITVTGNSRTPFLVTTAGLVLNIVLDPVLIFGIGPFPVMGVAGAAIATVLAQALVTLLYVLYARRDAVLLQKVNILARPDLEKIKGILRIGLPSAVQGALFTSISMVLARTVATFGDTAIAVQKVGSQIESISWMTADGFSAALNSFVAQNYGAGNFERTKRGFYNAFSIMAVWGVFTSLLLIFAAAPIFRIFIHEAEALPLGVGYLVILGFSQLFCCVEIMVGGAFSGFGRTLPPSITSIVLTSARIPMAAVLSTTALGLDGVWWSITISSILKGAVLLVWFLLFLRRETNRHAQAAMRSA